MFQFLKIAQAVSALKSAIADRSLAGIEAAAVSLAGLVGLSKEAASLVAVVDAAKSGSVSATLRAAGQFLIDVADAIAGPAVMFAAPGGDTAPQTKDDDGPKLACVAECLRAAKACHQDAATAA